MLFMLNFAQHNINDRVNSGKNASEPKVDLICKNETGIVVNALKELERTFGITWQEL